MATRALSNTVNGGRLTISVAGGTEEVPGVVENVLSPCAIALDVSPGTAGAAFVTIAVMELFVEPRALEFILVAETGLEWKENHPAAKAMAMTASNTQTFFMT